MEYFYTELLNEVVEKQYIQQSIQFLQLLTSYLHVAVPKLNIELLNTTHFNNLNLYNEILNKLWLYLCFMP